MAKVPGLYHQPDGRHWLQKPHVHQHHPLPQEPHHICHNIHKFNPHDKLDLAMNLGLCPQPDGHHWRRKPHVPLPQEYGYIWHIIHQIDPHDKPDLTAKVPGLYHQPDGRRKPYVHQHHPLPKESHYIWHIIHQINPHDKPDF